MLLLRIHEKQMEELGIKEVNFSRAVFDNGPFGDTTLSIIEKQITTTTGPFVVSWSFRAVKDLYYKERGVETHVRPRIVRRDGQIVQKACLMSQTRVMTVRGLSDASVVEEFCMDE